MLHSTKAVGHHAHAGVRRGLPRTACAALLTFALAALAQASAPPVARPAPDFVLRSLEGANLRLSEHMGEVVMVTFWATWCGPCQQQLPALDELYNKYRRAGLVLLAVNIDDDAARATAMAQALKLTYPVLFDTRKEVSRAYDLGTMPLTILIDREGVVRYVSEGYRPGFDQVYAEQLRKLLNE